MKALQLLLCWLVGGGAGGPATPAERELEEADKLAALARVAAPEAREKAVEEALRSYDALLAAHGKDQKFAPRVRRHRATLLKGVDRPLDALKEHDAIVAGRARRKDKARALCDGAALLVRAGDLHGAERRLARAIDEYGDVANVRAEASLERGRLLCRTGRTRDAVACWLHVVERCRDEEKIAIEAYDELALLAIEEGDAREARKWLRACTDAFGKRAARDDKQGKFLSRQLGAMKAPQRLAGAERPIEDAGAEGARK